MELLVSFFEAFDNHRELFYSNVIYVMLICHIKCQKLLCNAKSGTKSDLLEKWLIGKNMFSLTIYVML